MEPDTAIKRIQQIVRMKDQAAMAAAAREENDLHIALNALERDPHRPDGEAEADAWRMVLHLLCHAAAGGDDEEGPVQTLARARREAGNVLVHGVDYQEQLGQDHREDELMAEDPPWV